ncbi:MAG: cation:proton antiporter domain-containing protein [Gaiellales bacterium]
MVQFGEIVLLVGAGLLGAVAMGHLGERVRVPAPAVFLLLAAGAAEAFPSVSGVLSSRDVGRVATVALIVILFDGGVDIGWQNLRPSIGAVASLGILGTLATAGLGAAAAHWLLGFQWSVAGALGAALSPTDPAVVFSVLGGREPRGRSGVILKGESGANDPVSIALMVGVVDAVQHGSDWSSTVAEDLSMQLVVGLAVGVAGAKIALRLLPRVSPPTDSLQPVLTVITAALVYGAAASLHGSGFLAVFAAGLLLGDAEHRVGEDVRAFHRELAGLAEVVVFVALGLTIDLGSLIDTHALADGLLLIAIVILAVRPPVVAALLARARLTRAERIFIAWAGLRGAVPILLASVAVEGGVGSGAALYGIVFVAVATSVIVQGSLLTEVARAVGLPLRDPHPGVDTEAVDVTQ